MLEKREKLENKLTGIFEKRLNINPDDCKIVLEYLSSVFSLQESKAMDVIAERRSVSELEEYELFFFAYALDQTLGGIQIETYFNKNEINAYKEIKYEEDTFNFPIQIQCTQVSNDQWIGSCDVDFFIKLRKAQLINYNINAQRTLKRVVKDGNEIYKIALNKKAISTIKECFDNSSYIPNTITLNIPEDEFDWKYDEKKNLLIINSIKYFDIADGYHRYIAMCQEKDANENFNYPMEIRIINFSDDRIKQFIFQEDQKTKMQKIESDSMNMNAPENIVLERLNRNIMFDLKGEIGRNKTKIDLAEFAQVIKFFYFKSKDKNEHPNVKVVEEELCDNLNGLFAKYPEYLEHKYDFIDLMIVTYCIVSKKNKKQLADNIDGLIKNKAKMKMEVFKTRKPNNRMVREIENLAQIL